MNKIKSFLTILVFGTLSFLGLQKNVNAQSYDLSFEAYHAKECGAITNKTSASSCLTKYFNGDLNTHRISNGNIEKGEIIMVLVNITPSSDSELFGLQAEIGSSDSSKLSLLKATAINEADTETSYGVLPYNDFEGATTWSHSLKVNAGGTAILQMQDDAGMDDMMPLIKSGTLGALFFQASEDLVAGDKVQIQYLKSDEYPGGTDQYGDPSITQYIHTLDISLSVASNISTDNTLKTLTATGNNTLNYPFGFVPSSKSNLNYNFIVPYAVDKITFSGEPTDSKSLGTTGLDIPHTLQVGDNEIVISVIAESGDTEFYKINVKRLSNVATLSSVTATNDISFTSLSDTTLNSVTVPYKITNTFVSATTTDTNASITSGIGTWNILTDNMTNKSNTYSIVVGAEDCKYTTTQVPGNVCTTKTYNFEIIRTAPSKDVTLSDLQVDGVTIPGFSPTIKEYTLDQVNSDKTSINISATPNDSLSTVTSGIGNNIAVEVGENTYTIVVTGEDGTTTNSYTIHLYRKSNETQLASLTVNSTPNGTLSPNFIPSFDAESGEYTYYYTADVTSISIAATVKDTNKAFITILDMSENESALNTNKKLNSDSKTFNTDTKKVGIVVTGEDGSTRVYKVKLERSKSTNANLSTIKVTGSDGKEYTVNQASVSNQYKVSVPGTVEKVTILVTAEDSKAEVLYQTPDVGTLNVYSIPVGTSNKEVKIKSESGDVTIPYNIEITREAKKDATLKTLEYSFTENGEKHAISLQDGVFDYTIPNILYETSKLYLFADPTDTDAQVANTGMHDVATGDNTFKLTVTAQDTNVTKDYTIHLNRALNSDATLKNLEVQNYTFEESLDLQNKFEYHMVVDETKDMIYENEITAIANDSVKASVVKTSGNLALSTTEENSYTITVTAENGTKKEYKIYIVRPKSTDTRLGQLNLTNASISPSFDKEKRDGYIITVPYGKEEFTVEGIPYLSTSTVMSGNKTYKVAETNEVIIEVKSESGKVENYTFQIEEALSDDSSLASLSVKDYSFTNDTIFNSSITNYQIGSVDRNLEKLVVYASATNSDSTIKYYLENTLIPICNNQTTCEIAIPDEVGKKTISVEVLAADKNESHKTTYQIEYLKTASSNPYLESIEAIDTKNNTLSLNAVFEKEQLNYEITVPNEIDAVTITFTSEDDRAKVTVNSGEAKQKTNRFEANNLKVGANPIQILVTAEDGSFKQYSVIVNRENPLQNSDNTLSTLQVMDVDHTIYPLNPTFSKEEENYTIGEIPFALDTLKIEVTKDASANVTYLVNGNIQSSNIVTIPKKNGNGVITVRVTAENQDIKEYKINYSKQGNNTATLSEIKVNNGTLTPTFDADTHVYTVNVENSIDSIGITAIASNDKQILLMNKDIYTSGEEKNISLEVGTNLITIVVTAEDGTTDTYSVVINREEAPILSSDTSLAAIMVNQSNLIPSFSSDNHTYTVNVENSVDSIEITGVAANEKQTLKMNNESYTSGEAKTIPYLPVGNTTVEMKIIAEDGSEGTYTVVINRKEADILDNNTSLMAIMVNQSNLNPSFDPKTKNYTVDVENEIENIKITAVAANDKQTLTMNNEAYVSGTAKTIRDLEVGPTTIDILVTAEDGSKDTYTIRVNRKEPSLSNDTTLENIKLSVGTLKPSYNALIRNYVVDLKNDINRIDLTAIAANGHQTLTINGEAYTSGEVKAIKNIPVGVSNIKIEITAEDGSKDSYIITVNRVAEEEIEKITSIEFGHTIIDGYIKTVADEQTVLDLKNQLDNENTRLEIYDATNTRKLEENELVGTGMIVKLVNEEGNILDQQIIIIKGDVNGDGIIDMEDAGNVINHYMNRFELTGVAYLAAEVAEDGIIDMEDVGNIANHYMKRFSIPFMRI